MLEGALKHGDGLPDPITGQVDELVFGVSIAVLVGQDETGVTFQRQQVCAQRRTTRQEFLCNGMVNVDWFTGPIDGGEVGIYYSHQPLLGYIKRVGQQVGWC